MNKKTISIIIACLIVLNGLMVVNAADEGILEEFFNHFKKTEPEDTQMTCIDYNPGVKFRVTSENMTKLVNKSKNSVDNAMSNSNITVNFTDKDGNVTTKTGNITVYGKNSSNTEYYVVFDLAPGTYNYTAYFSGNELFKASWLNGTIELKEQVKTEDNTTKNTTYNKTNNTTGTYKSSSKNSENYYSSSNSYSSDSSGYTYKNGTRYYYRYYYVYV